MSSLFSFNSQSAGRHFSAKKQHGFALLITVTLLAFLVLLLVSLAALTRVETQVAANNQIIARARQNALMALNIAIGQLQKYAGRDSRITAQGSATNSAANNPWFTGIWDGNSPSEPTATVWLVSGNELNPVQYTQSTNLNRTAANPDIDLILDSNGLATNGPSSTNPNRVRLVGPGVATVTGSGLSNGAVVVPGVPINAEVAGLASTKTIGRYAYWVGDLGVKASLGLPDRSNDINYAPWLVGSDNQSSRIRQQIATVPSYFRNLTTEKIGFDPLNSTNDAVRGKLLTAGQFQFLAPISTTAPLNTYFHDHYHETTTAAVSLLANTLPDSNDRRGLMQDLSLDPGLLGDAFKAYANYDGHLNAATAYMEAPSFGNTAVPPITSLSSERRRYTLLVPVTTVANADMPKMEFGVSPVLNSFILQFNVERVSGNVVVRCRMFTELWNPYTAALVPPTDLSMEITGLPDLRITDSSSGEGSMTFSLQNVPAIIRGSGAPVTPMAINLPFTTAAQTDKASWLPGRIYAWVTQTGASPTASLNFYNKNMSAQGWSYIAQPLAGTSPNLQVEVNTPTTLTVKIKTGNNNLATYTSPVYPPVLVSDVETPASYGNWMFAFGFRLKQPSFLNRDRDWLTDMEDFRGSPSSGDIFTAFNENLDIDPEAYTNTPGTSTGISNFLLYRAAGTSLSTTRSANNDAPVFELPRIPNLSLGELQHLQFPGGKPFALGNPWGKDVLNASGENINSWFDRFFFSGVPATGASPDIAQAVPLPNWNLYPTDSRISPSTPFDLTALRDGGNAYTSRFLMQAGGFNVNSTSALAWRAVLSGVRFSVDHPFNRAFIDNSSTINNYTGSQILSNPAALPDPAVTAEKLTDSTLDSTANVGGPSFFRFPQSAQETYYWSNSSIGGDLSKQAFRQGVRGGDETITGSTLQQLTTAQIETVAQKIVVSVRDKMAASGPFRSMEEFLSPQALYGNKSILQKAIDDSGINPASIATNPVPALSDPGFSSLTLTQADIMTALAPYLRTRSDTFVIRTYGEVINPVTSVVEGRAWCEATVQRFPGTVSISDSITAPSNSGFGRRYKITQFRWLSSTDI